MRIAELQVEYVGVIVTVDVVANATCIGNYIHCYNYAHELNLKLRS